MNSQSLERREYEPPDGWTAEVFAAVTDALAAALVAACSRYHERAEAECGES